MSNDRSDADLKKKLYDAIEDVRTGMLGLTSKPGEHFQPMTARVEDGDSTIWFFSRKDTDLARETAGGQPAMFTLQAKSFWACVGGTLTTSHDKAKIDQFWNPIAAAWYPEGKDDPQLTLLRFDPDEAQVWAQEGSGVKFAFEIAKANLTKTLPDAGDQATLKL